VETCAKTDILTCRRWTWALGAGLAGFIAYFGVWNLTFASDDVALIYRMRFFGWDGIKPFLLPETGAQGVGYQAYYRPLVVLFTAGEYLFWGTTPGGYHLSNLIVYSLTCSLVFLLVSEVVGSRFVSLATALLFAVHPLHTMNVAWVSGRTDLFASFFMLGSILAYVRWSKSGKRNWIWMGLLAEFLGLCSKEIAFLTPFLAAATEWTRVSHENTRASVATVLRKTAAWWVLPLLWGAMIAGGTPFLRSFSWAVSVREALVNLAGSIVLLFSPLDYEVLLRWFAERPVLAACAGTLCAAGVLLVVGRTRSCRSTMLWGLIWLCVSIVPTYRATMRWYLFLPSVGICVVLAGACASFSERWRVFLVVLLVLAFTLGLVNERRKWAIADSVNRSALSSLLTNASGDSIGRVVILTTPAKVRRMPVFGGNTESFFRIHGGMAERVDVVSHLALDDPFGVVRCSRRDMSTLTLELAEGEGEFLPLKSRTRLRGPVVGAGDTVDSDAGTVVVAKLSGAGGVRAVDVSFPHADVQDSKVLLFTGGKFVPFTLHAGE